MSVQII